MSTIWTPSGERPIRPQPEPEVPEQAARGGAPPAGESSLTEEELAARMAEVQRQLLETPASVIVANHCIGFFQLAALHLDQRPPNLVEAQLAIDAMAAVVEGLGPRLGEDHTHLQEALTQMRLAFVQIKAASAGGDTP